MRRHQRVPAKGLRSLHPKQSRTIHGPRNDAAAVAPFRNPLQRVAHRQCRHRSIGPTPNSSNHTLKQPRRSPRPGSVMTNHHINIIRNRLQPSPNRPRPSPPTSHTVSTPPTSRSVPSPDDQCHSITSRPSRLNTQATIAARIAPTLGNPQPRATESPPQQPIQAPKSEPPAKSAPAKDTTRQAPRARGHHETRAGEG